MVNKCQILKPKGVFIEREISWVSLRYLNVSGFPKGNGKKIIRIHFLVQLNFFAVEIYF
jgi:hypothetical protein